MIVVTGATGNVGRQLVESLAGSGHAVTAVSRGVSAPAPTADGVTWVRADLADAASLAPALEGADALFLLVSGAGAHVDGSAVVKRAAAAGVQRVTLLSSEAAGTRPDSAAYAPLARLERAVSSSDLAWTILQAGGFMTNTFAWAQTIREQRTVYSPYPDVALPMVDPFDIAQVAAATLTDATHAGHTYVLKGPEPISPRERTAVLGAALGEDLSLVELDHAAARAQLLHVMPEPIADGTLAVLGHPTDDERAVSPDVEAVLGRRGTDFASWAARNAAAFR